MLATYNLAHDNTLKWYSRLSSHVNLRKTLKQYFNEKINEKNLINIQL